MVSKCSLTHCIFYLLSQEREKIFLVHLKPITLQADLKVEDVAKRMASLTPGFVGADIVTRLEKASLLTV